MLIDFIKDFCYFNPGISSFLRHDTLVLSSSPKSTPDIPFRRTFTTVQTIRNFLFIVALKLCSFFSPPVTSNFLVVLVYDISHVKRVPDYLQGNQSTLWNLPVSSSSRNRDTTEKVVLPRRVSPVQVVVPRQLRHRNRGVGFTHKTISQEDLLTYIVLQVYFQR